MIRSNLVGCLLVGTLFGCFRSHVNEAGASGDSGLPDMSTPSTVVPVPGRRPSDEPEAEEWEDPPSTPPRDVCCELGDPIEVALPGEQGGQMDVAWHGSGWAIVFASDSSIGPDAGARYVSLDPEVTRVEARSFLPAPGAPGDIRPVGREIGVALGQWAGRGDLYFGLVDTSGDAVTDFQPVPGGPEVTLAHERRSGRWTLATLSEEALVAHVLERDGNPVSTHALGGVPARDHGTWTAEGLGSRTVVAWIEGGSLLARNLDASAGPMGPTVEIGDGFAGSDESIASTAFRDSLVVSDLVSDEVLLTFYDPFAGTALQRRIGEGAVRDRAVELAGSPKTGLIGVCIPTGSGGFGGGGGENDGVDFQLVRPDGTTYGSRIPIVDGLRNIGGCAVGAQGRTFVVLWWRASGGPDYNSLWARRVTPRL